MNRTMLAKGLDGPVPARAGGVTPPIPLVLVAVTFVTLLLSRRPAVLLHADFWAEDGWVWYPDAYSLGLRCLFRPLAGYLQTSSRLVALIAQAFPLAWAPTLFAGAALLIQALPAVFLVSPRMDRAWPSLWARLLFALIYIALPNSYEVYANLTNAQWHLAVLAFLVLVSQPPPGRAGKAFDAAVLLLSGLSGPFCLLLAPVAAWVALERRDRASTWRLGAVLATCVVQGGFVLATVGSRSGAPLAAGPWTFARIVSMQILIGVLLGQTVMDEIHSSVLWSNNAVPMLVAVAGLALAGFGAARGPGLLRKACLFSALLFGAALTRPQVSSDPQWPLLTHPGIGDRYYYTPMLTWIGVLFALASDRLAPLRWTGIALLALLVVGVPLSWAQPDMPSTNFVTEARAFDAAPPGTRMEFAVHPTGAPPMVLIK